MMLFFDSNAIRFLKKLDKKERKRIMEKLDKAKERPKQHFTKLKGADFWKLRIGNYRVVVAIDRNRIRVLRIGLRKNIYKRLKR